MARAAVTLHTAEAMRGLAALGKKGPSVVARALKRAATSTRAYMAREIAGDVSLRVGRVKDEIVIATDATMATLTIKGARIPLIEFSARGPEPSRGRGTGVRYRIGATANRIPRGFIATMRSGHRGVFERMQKGGQPSKARLPINEKFGPSLPHVFHKFTPAGLAHGAEQLRKNLEHEFRYALSSLKG